ncbi:MAG: hypothetical protein GPJ54_09970 [Candidatus Heimdallarchaeota archaeon]|nr:hypothetical protein [Candidatus Heimdallarchaeota archaeon]
MSSANYSNKSRGVESIFQLTSDIFQIYFKSTFFFNFVEASHLLDLKKLMGDNPPNLLIPISKKKQSLISRYPDNLGLILVIIAVSSLIYDWLVNSNGYILALFAILIVLIFAQMNRIKGLYYISEKGLIVPYTWLTQKRIELNSIVEIHTEKLIQKDTKTEIDGIRIIIDNPALKFNITGIQESNIILTASDYDKIDLEIFSEELHKYKRNDSRTGNTLAQRLDDQVNRSWFGRWKLIFLNTFDSSTEFGFFFLLIYIILNVPLENRLRLLFILISVLYILAVLIFNISDRPSSIVGFRGHELGPLLYNEADVLTTVRFITMSQPSNVELIDCELLFQSEPISQINELKELHPKEVESGVLTYCVAQFAGNQTKSIGVNIRFRYIDQIEVEYELPIYWA